MKNIVILILVFIAGFFAYNHLSQKGAGCGCSTGPNSNCVCPEGCSCVGVSDGQGNLRCACGEAKKVEDAHQGHDHSGHDHSGHDHDHKHEGSH